MKHRKEVVDFFEKEIAQNYPRGITGEIGEYDEEAINVIKRLHLKKEPVTTRSTYYWSDYFKEEEELYKQVAFALNQEEYLTKDQAFAVHDMIEDSPDNIIAQKKLKHFANYTDRADYFYDEAVDDGVDQNLLITIAELLQQTADIVELGYKMPYLILNQFIKISGFHVASMENAERHPFLQTFEDPRERGILEKMKTLQSLE